MGFSSSFNPLGPDYGDQATVIFRDKGSEAQVHVSTMLFEKDGRPFLDFDAPGRTALIATDLSGRDVLFIQRDGTLAEKFEAMEKVLGITPQGERREPSGPPFNFDDAVKAFQEWEPSETSKGDAELGPIAAMNRRHLSRLGRPRSEDAHADHEAPKRRDRSPERKERAFSRASARASENRPAFAYSTPSEAFSSSRISNDLKNSLTGSSMEMDSARRRAISSPLSVKDADLLLRRLPESMRPKSSSMFSTRKS